MREPYIKIGMKAMLIMGVYLVVLSILWIFVTEIMFVSDFLAYTGQSYPDYLDNDPRFAEIYIITKKMVGILLLIIGVMIILITQKSYVKNEQWVWYALLITGSLVWETFIIYKLIIRYIGFSMLTFVVGAILFLIGIILPAKEFFSKK